MKPDKKPQLIISALYIVAFCAVLWAVFMGELTFSDTQEKLANLLVGILSAGLMQIMNFWFGSSSGSKDKTAQMETKQ